MPATRPTSKRPRPGTESNIAGSTTASESALRPFRRSPNPIMTESNARRRLIIVCGLPGAGKTTLAKSLEQSLQAIRFSADEWMEALSLDLYNEESRGKIEALQWTLGKEL